MNRMRSPFSRLGLAFTFFSLAIPAFAQEPQEDITQDNSIADQIFPYYTLECSVTQVNPIHGAAGGTGGHALMYIKGACRDTSKNFPKLKLCDPHADATKAATGVALSVDKILSNTQYIPSDGKHFMFDGALKAGESVNSEVMARTRAAIVKSGSMKGVKIHDEYMRKKIESEDTQNMSDEEYIAKVGIDTDYAILFARTANCVLVPMSRSQIAAEVAYVNKTNKPYAEQGKIYHWDGVSDNCTHFTHDVLAAAGVGKMMPRSNSIFRKIFNFLTFHLAIPKNETLESELAVNDLSKIKTAEEVYGDKTLKSDFRHFGTLPQMGGIFQIEHMNADGNEEFKSSETALFLDPLKMKAKELKAVETKPDYTDFASNLTRLRDRLAEVDAQKTSLNEDDKSKFARFKRKYDNWIEQSIKSLDDKIAKLQ